MTALIKQAWTGLARIFLQGLIAVLPLAVTVALLYWLVTMAESFLGGLVRFLFPDWDYWPGLGTLLGIALIFAMGLTMNAWIARRLWRRAEAIMARIPVIKSIYGSIRDLAGSMASDESGRNFQTVVSVEVTPGVRIVGFVTREDLAGLPSGLGPQDSVCVYLPMSYQIGGYAVFVPKSLVTPIDMSLEDAMRFTLTAAMSGVGDKAASR